MKVLTGLELIRFIRDDHIKLKDKDTLVSFRWFVGIDYHNKSETFRYVKGGDLKRWGQATINYKRIYGPFKSKKDSNEFIINKNTQNQMARN